MKILFFIPSLKNSAWNEHISVDLANGLSEKGMEVDFVVHDVDVKSFFNIHKSIYVHFLGLTGKIRDNKFKAAYRLRKLIKKHHYEMIVNIGVACNYVSVLAFPPQLGCKVIS